jgi:hypothetical protein
MQSKTKPTLLAVEMKNNTRQNVACIPLPQVRTHTLFMSKN